MSTLNKYLKRYFVDAMSAMALGLFASLLIGTIFSTVAKYLGMLDGMSGVAAAIDTVATYAKAATGIVVYFE